MNKKENSLLEKIWTILQDNSKELTKITTHVAVLNEEMGEVQKDIREIKNSHSSELKDIKENYVTKTEFSPIQKIVFGIVGAILLAVLAAILALVIK